MPWSGLLKVLDSSRAAQAVYKSLVLRIEDSESSGWLVRLYDGETVVGEAIADGPRQAVVEVVELAKRYLKDDSISADSLAWVQTSR